VRDDARLDRRRAALVRDQAAARIERARFFERVEQAFARAVAPHDPDDKSPRAERVQIGEHVGRAAEAHRLAPYVHDGHGRFRRDARHVAPDEFVEHYVAVDDDAPPRDIRGQLRRALWCDQFHSFR
jgi:hypothetical protein